MRLTGSVLNAVVFRQPFHRDYEYWINRGAELADSNIDPGIRVQLYHTLCVSQIFARNFGRADFFVKRFRGFVD